MSRPASPSTSLITVSATITPSRPLSTRVCSIGFPFPVSPAPSDCRNILSILIILINISDMSTEWMSSREAARRLGVSAATLYAYVSRGLLRSEAVDGRRERRYRADDISRLKRRRDVGRKAESIANHALDFGTPVLESALTLIEDGRLYYRGLGTGAHRVAGGDRPPLVELRRQAVRRRQRPAHDHGAAPRLAGRGHARAGRSLPRAAAGGGRARPSELGRGPAGDARDRRPRDAAADGGGDRAAALPAARPRAARRRLEGAA